MAAARHAQRLLRAAVRYDYDSNLDLGIPCPSANVPTFDPSFRTALPPQSVPAAPPDQIFPTTEQSRQDIIAARAKTQKQLEDFQERLDAKAREQADALKRRADEGGLTPMQQIEKLKQQAAESEARKQKILEEASTPNEFGKLTPAPAPTEQSPLVVNLRGELEPRPGEDPEAPGYKPRYSNPSAARLAQVSQEAGERYKKAPTAPNTNIVRSGYLSVRPSNMQCDANGRNCKFSGPVGTSAAGSTAPGDVADGKFLRSDLEMLKGGL